MLDVPISTPTLRAQQRKTATCIPSAIHVMYFSTLLTDRYGDKERPCVLSLSLLCLPAFVLSFSPCSFVRVLLLCRGAPKGAGAGELQPSPRPHKPPKFEIYKTQVL